MKTIKLLILGIGIIFISSCTKEKLVTETDYLIFGHFHGECIGEECVLTFKLTDTKLYEDVTHNYSGNDLDFQKMDHAAFQEVRDLMHYFPLQLLNETDTVIGCPDCRDQGGLFIEYSQNGVVNSWRIDKTKSAVPEYLHEFMDEVKGKIQLIKP
jgi:hypothetical protein